MLAVHKTQDVAAKLFGKTHEETCKQFNLPHLNRPEYAQQYPFGVHLTTVPNGMKVSIGFRNYTTLIQFTLEYYPTCCGSRLFHTFTVSPQITQEQLDEIMNTFFNENKYGTADSSEFLGRSNRLEVIMVERRPIVGRDPMTDVQPVENPHIEYKTLWNFFHKYAKRVRTRLEINANTGNVLHNMEVLF